MSKFVFALVVIVVVVLIISIYPPNPTVTDKEVRKASTFEECVKEGNPVLESYPPTCRTKDGKLITQNVGNELILKDKIRIKTPRPVEKVQSPLNVTGEARGTWFFEGQFGAKVLNEDGEVIGEGIMTTPGEWMSEELIPFSGEIVFDKKKSKKGKLILEKANPSDLAENNETLIVPVEF